MLLLEVQLSFEGVKVALGRVQGIELSQIAKTFLLVWV